MPSTGRAKKAVNVSIPAELLDAARHAEINLSATLEAAVEQELRKQRREKWLEDNAGSIAAYNLYVEANGAFSDGLRSF